MKTLLKELANKHEFKLQSPASLQLIKTAKSELNIPMKLCELYAISNGLQHEWFRIPPLYDPENPKHTWDSLQRTNDPEHSKYLTDAELPQEYLVFAEISGPDFAVISRKDGRIWFAQREELHQTDLSLVEFIRVILREVDGI